MSHLSDRVQSAILNFGDQLSRSWTVAELARTAGLSRSSFFDRFTRTVGLPPMEYLLAWRMAVAKDLLRRQDLGIDEVAERVGYGSASTFSTAFSRYVGQPPRRYARIARVMSGMSWPHLGLDDDGPPLLRTTCFSRRVRAASRSSVTCGPPPAFTPEGTSPEMLPLGDNADRHQAIFGITVGYRNESPVVVFIRQRDKCRL